MVSPGRAWLSCLIGTDAVDDRDRDRRKLTFYFIAEKRIDFRELVRELFRWVSQRGVFAGTKLTKSFSFCRIHKTRIWMASLDHSYLQDDDNKS